MEIKILCKACGVELFTIDDDEYDEGGELCDDCIEEMQGEG